MPMPYNVVDVEAALVAAQRRWSFRYERVASDGTVSDETVVSCTVKHEDLADVKRTCDVVLPASSSFDQLTDRLRPYARLMMPDGDWQEWPLGTFYLQSSRRRRASAAGDSLSARVGYDGTLRMQEDKLSDRHVVAAGVAYTTAVKDQLTAAGLPTSSVSDVATTLPAAMEWEPGTTRLKVVNDLLAAINYRPLAFDAYGTPVVVPYIPPDEAPVLWRYAVDASSVVRPGVDTELDLFGMPNRWIAFVSQPDLPPLRAVLTNSDPADPLSTVGRGRVIAKVLDASEVGEAPTQAILDALVERAAQEERSQYERASFETGLMPIHGSGDVCELDVGDGVVRYREVSWEIELRAGGSMKHEMRRVVQL
jgi:hypothetical protein